MFWPNVPIRTLQKPAKQQTSALGKRERNSFCTLAFYTKRPTSIVHYNNDGQHYC